MKTILTTAFLAVAMLFGIPIPFQGDQVKLEMQLSADEVFANKVKIFDYEGNLLKELRVDDVADHEISISDYLILESSGYAFTYQGDYYFLRE